MPDIRQRRGEVRNQIVRIFEADVKAHQRSGIFAPCGRAELIDVGRHRKAFEPAPAVADAEQFEAVDQPVAGCLVAALESEGEQARTSPMKSRLQCS